MGLETRIGVVVGLVIVVVASVYFFYGSSHEVDEVFLPATPRVATAPKIPPNGQPVAPGRSLVDRVQIPRREVPRPAINAGTSPATPQTPVAQRPSVQPNVSPASPITVVSADRPRGALPDQRTATPLRTGPSDELVGATWDNLTKQDKPQPSAQTGGAAPATQQPGAAAGPSNSANRPSGSPQPPQLHRVRPGDTLSAIAKQYLGASGTTDAMLKVNPQLRRGRALKIGEMLFIPDGAASGVSVAAKSEPAPAKPAPAATYRVVEGDTFYSIAKQVYGDSARWGELYRLNRSVVKGDPKRLKAGMVLKLPPK